MVSLTNAAPYEAIQKREDTPVWVEFKDLASTFTEFQSSESSASPDYNHLAYDLNDLSTTADAAYSLLRKMGKTQLTSNNGQSTGKSYTVTDDITEIKESLATFASASSSVEEMAVKGKVWYEEKQVVGKISQILELDAFQFYILFKELKNHVNQTIYSEFGKDMSTTLCGFVNAIEIIEPNTFGSNKSAYTYCVNYKAGLRGNLATDGFDINSVAPPGIDSCGNSASRFLDAAYSEGTLGSTVTKCTEKNVGIIGPSLPKNALGLKEWKN